jgi:hypothetical protein
MALESFSLDVPDGQGGWRTAIPEFGYMAGKSRTMAIEVTPHLHEALRDGQLHLRLRSNLAVHIDQAYLARDLSALPGMLEVTEAGPAAAEVSFVGFPREYSPDGAKPLLYDYATRDASSDFKTLPGHYSRYGNVLELVTEADDRFAIFGRGEQVALEFPEPAFSRAPETDRKTTWFLRARGYCKDMCPLTAHPDTLEPLPYAAMGNYPPEVDLGKAHPSRLSPLNQRYEPATRADR